MKKIFLVSLFGFFGYIHSVQAQVTITYAADSTGGTCIDASYPVGFYLTAEAIGYTTGDVVTFYVDFGDGIDTTFTQLFFAGIPPETGYAIMHQYAANGTYDVTYAVTMPDLQSDTLFVPGEVNLGNCDAISGNVYVDAASNCIFNVGDSPIQGVYVNAYDNITGDPITGTVTDAMGYYELFVPSGIDVKLITSVWGTLPDFVCPSSNELITTSPSTDNDFAINPYLMFYDAGDSNDIFCFDAPTPIDFYLNGETYGYTPSDVPTIYIDFGDGTNITMADPDFATTFPYIDFTITHNYLTPGNFDLTYVITMPNLNSDTIFVSNEVFLGSCDTISGYVYHDQNTNCIFEGGDIPIQTTLSAIDNLTGSYYLSTNSDATGYYEFILPAGLPVTINVDFYSAGLIICPVAGQIITSSPSNGNDFALAPGVAINYITDSTTIYCSNASDSAYFVIFAETYGFSPSDVPTIYTDFGDGTDTTFLDFSFAINYPYVYTSYAHNYVNAGSYDVTYIVTMPGSMADTLTIYNNVIIEPCEIISGYVYDDNNTNCILDGTDTPLYMNVYAHDAITGSFLSYATTDANGYYELYLPPSVDVEISLSSYFTGMLYVCPVSGVLTTNAPSNGNDFAITGNGFDLLPFGWFGFFHPGFTEEISIGAWDLGCLNTPDVQLRVVVNDPLITFVGGEAIGGDIIPDISGDTLTWDIPSAYISGLYTGSYAPSLTMEFTTDVTATIGDIICMNVITEPITGDVDPSNNIQEICFPVANSYDPNYIEVSPHGISPVGLIDPNLEMVYTIHFQNTGTFPAVNITIKDSLNGNVLDLSSFEYLASSHALSNILSDGSGGMAFLFDNINLPDSTSDEPNSHGWITYRVKQQPNLLPTTTIENTAHIYFDFNSPIVTNTAINTIKNPLSVDEIGIANEELTIYPVPSKDLITVITNSNEAINYQIVDINGNLVQHGSVTNGDQLTVSSFSNGVYFFKLENGSVEKIVIQK